MDKVFFFFGWYSTDFNIDEQNSSICWNLFRDNLCFLRLLKQLKNLDFEELQMRLSALDPMMEREIEELRQRYTAKRQPILDAMDAKKRRQQNFWKPCRGGFGLALAGPAPALRGPCWKASAVLLHTPNWPSIEISPGMQLFTLWVLSSLLGHLASGVHTS